MTRRVIRLGLVLAIVQGFYGLANAQKLSVRNGNVCIVVAGETKKLTSSGHDSEPVLAPDGKWIVFIRTVPSARPLSSKSCLPVTIATTCWSNSIAILSAEEVTIGTGC